VGGVSEERRDGGRGKRGTQQREEGGKREKQAENEGTGEEGN